MRWGLRVLIACCGCGISVEGVAPTTPAPSDDAGVTTNLPDTGAPEPPPENDASVTPIDGGVTPTDGGSLIDAGDVLPAGCVGADAFKFDGDASQRTDMPGVVILSLKAGKRAVLGHTFDHAKAYTRTKVDLLLDVDWQKTWGPAGNDYVPFIRQYFGADNGVATLIGLTMAQNVIEAHFEPAGPQTEDLNGMSVPKARGVHVVMESTWSNSAGKLVVTTTPGTSWPLNEATTASGTTATQLAIEIGGQPSGVVADVTIGVHQVCVTFDP